jgi:hypothetical protein
MVRAMDVELSRMGALETPEGPDTLERAVPESPKRGRKPKPRCEHGQIAERCVECNPELAV